VANSLIIGESFIIKLDEEDDEDDDDVIPGAR
jgi:hypothetical protein